MANPGSRFVASSELKRMVAPSADFAVSIGSLRSALREMLDKWGNNTYPPPYLRVDGRYLSLADSFQVMTDALAALDRAGKLPESARVVPVYGPLYTPTGHGPNVGDVTVAARCRAARAPAETGQLLHPGVRPARGRRGPGPGVLGARS